MLLEYEHKMSKKEILLDTQPCKLISLNGNRDSRNKLIHGDNLHVLKALLDDYDLREKIDLIYIDPPFSTQNVFKISESRANTISSSNSDSTAYSDLLSGADYIEFIRRRLILLKELMAETASIYLHIDYKIGHYVKIIMDEIFGEKNFRNDITRVKCNPKNFKRKAYGNIKDLILFYTKSDKYTWNDPKAPLTDEDIFKLFKKFDKNGRRYTTVPLHAPGETKDGPTGQPWKGMPPPKGRHWRSAPKVLDELDEKGLIEWSSNGVPRKIIYADKAKENGKKLQDIWEFKDYQYPSYPTEKNIDILKLIISASSNPKDLVVDCFCGSGTTLLAAQELDRNWIGIDLSELAIEVTQKKLENHQTSLFESELKYSILKVENLNKNV